MKLISWNVNGIRACVTKGFEDYFKETDADKSVIVCGDMNVTHSDIFIRIGRTSIHGGPTDSRRGRRMPDGVLIIFLCRRI